MCHIPLGLPSQLGPLGFKHSVLMIVAGILGCNNISDNNSYDSNYVTDNNHNPLREAWTGCWTYNKGLGR